MFNSNKYLINTPDQKRSRDDFSDYSSKSEIADSFMRSISIYVDAKSWVAVHSHELSQCYDDKTERKLREQEQRANKFFKDAEKKFNYLVQ